MEQRLIAAFRAMPSCPVYSTGRALLTLGGRRTPLTDVLEWGAVLDGDRDGRVFLLTWARCQATGEPFADAVRGKGCSRATAERGRRRAAETIAAHLRSTTSTPLDSEKTGNRASASDGTGVVLEPV